MDPIPRHKNFRLFGCMNPATDVGKKDMPPTLRSRMTEIYVDELQAKEDLLIVCNSYLSKIGGVPKMVVEKVVDFYLHVLSMVNTSCELTDGTNSKPQYSLRTLCRALNTVRLMAPVYGLARSLYEGFCSSFLTSISRDSYVKMQQLIFEYFGKDLQKGQLQCAPSMPSNGSSDGMYITCSFNFLFCFLIIF